MATWQTDIFTAKKKSTVTITRIDNFKFSTIDFFLKDKSFRQRLLVHRQAYLFIIFLLSQRVHGRHLDGDNDGAFQFFFANFCEVKSKVATAQYPDRLVSWLTHWTKVHWPGFESLLETDIFLYAVESVASTTYCNISPTFLCFVWIS